MAVSWVSLRVTPRGTTDILSQTAAWNHPPIHPSVHSQDISRAVPGSQALCPGLENTKWAKPHRVPAFAELTGKGGHDGHSNHTTELQF